MRGHETPENHQLTILKGFSTVSEVLFIFANPADQNTDLKLPPTRREGQYFFRNPDFGLKVIKGIDWIRYKRFYLLAIKAYLVCIKVRVNFKIQKVFNVSHRFRPLSFLGFHFLIL